ncbi:hypothetical protein LSH36_1198g00055 [Paralvinella palmiformis]|uniref:Uncharacterized protein n=1 Tax=Paralvinella palmiformis TaxID=53620 RepID=A0AAD9IVR2_9ANNE|nr:hypothetical protein LSH36_1198g00055 [Paralvinella palmiformis]
MKKPIDGKTGTLVQDAWINIHNQPIIASSLQVWVKLYLLDSHPTGSMAKTGENCNTLCEESIQKAKVSGICTDNAKNMERLRAALQQDDPDLTVRKPQLPGETRWKSQLTYLDRYITSRPNYMKIVQDHEDEIDQNIAKKIQDINIFRNAKDMGDQLRPVANAIDYCLADNASLAAACDT